MRLALIRQRYTPFGGAERFVDQALEALRASGVETTLITRRWEGKWDGPVQRVAPFYVGRWWRDAGFSRAVRHRLASERFDLAQSHERIPGCDMYRAGDGVHATWLELRSRFGGTTGQLAGVISPYHRYVVGAEAAMFHHSRLRAVICNSRMVADDIHRRFGVVRDRLHVIHNAVDTHRFNLGLAAQHRQSMRAQLGAGDDRRVWLTVGSGYQRKGVAESIEALARMAQDHLWVIGHDRKPRLFQRLAERLGVAERVRFLGPQADVTPFFGAADAFLLPSWYDPFPNACLEALACGLPVIVSTTSGTAELVRQGENGFVCQAGSADDLRQKMESLRPRLGELEVREAASNTVCELTPENMLRQFADLYRRLGVT